MTQKQINKAYDMLDIMSDYYIENRYCPKCQYRGEACGHIIGRIPCDEVLDVVNTLTVLLDDKEATDEEDC